MQAHTAKQDSIEAINRLPYNVPLDAIVNHLYVLTKVHQGMHDIDAGRMIASDELAKERAMVKWSLRA